MGLSFLDSLSALPYKIFNQHITLNLANMPDMETAFAAARALL